MLDRRAHAARLCVPVCVARARDLARAVGRAAALADVVELRLDCLEGPELDEAARALPSLLDDCPRPFVFTLRPKEQGGRRSLGLAERARLWTSSAGEVRAGEPAAGHFLRAARAGDFVDLELDLLESADRHRLEEAARACRVICSHHDFAGVPASLEEIYERMKATGAHVLKLAAQVDEITDCLKLFRLLERARREGVELIAVGMGEAGLLTRVLGPARGSFLTYGALDASGATAPGQPTAAELRDLYRVHSVGEQTAITGLVGSPVAHSLSPHMHNRALAACGLDGVYLPFEVLDVDAFVSRMAHPRTRELDWRLRGLSVTAPHKQAIMRHLDWVEPKAAEIGAVNTLVAEGAELHGYNTDAEAAVEPLRDFLELSGARVAVIGAGGAARALLWGLRERGARIVVFARRQDRAREVAAQFNAESAALGDARFDGFDVVVNATPLGTRGHAEGLTPATAAQLSGARLVYDLVYNPSETCFMREGSEAGCLAVGGLPMLVAQAAEQFRLWTGREAPVKVMRAAAEKQMLDVGG